jgi:acetyl-CoA carboxylase carboxyl transferase subunit alpha
MVLFKEPLGGAHTDPEAMFASLKDTLLKEIEKLQKVPVEKLVPKRMDKFLKMGVYKD